jgi:hypothetical protein
MATLGQHRGVHLLVARMQQFVVGVARWVQVAESPIALAHRCLCATTDATDPAGVDTASGYQVVNVEHRLAAETPVEPIFEGGLALEKLDRMPFEGSLRRRHFPPTRLT